MSALLAPIRFVLALAAVLLAFGLVTSAFGATPVTVRGAVERAARERLGAVTSLRVEGLTTEVADRPGLTARPAPGARVGSPARFVLAVGRTRVGYAVATITAVAPQVRARRDLPRDVVIEAGDVVVVEEAVGDVALRRLPGLDDVIGAQPRRTIAAGERVTSALVRVPPAVRSGDEVVTTLRNGRVVVVSRGIASGTGHVGDVIKVRHAGSRRLLKARITAPAAVEVLQ